MLIASSCRHHNPWNPPLLGSSSASASRAVRKSAANKAKHGIDFIEAQALWLDEALVEVPAKTDDEPRFLAVGRIAGRYWSAVCVRRDGRARIISVRRARREEVEAYESE